MGLGLGLGLRFGFELGLGLGFRLGLAQVGAAWRSCSAPSRSASLMRSTARVSSACGSRRSKARALLTMRDAAARWPSWWSSRAIATRGATACGRSCSAREYARRASATLG